MRASTDGLPIEHDLSRCFDSASRNALQPGNAAISRSETTPLEAVSIPWWSELSRAHWWVLIVAVLGWLFDAMDQRLFILARTPALRDLLPASAAGQLPAFAGWATGLFIAGWATGGLLFGLLGDCWGRVRTMTLTILVYSLFTGLSGLARSWPEFAAYRFMCGMGIGGEYAVGVALVAETIDLARSGSGWFARDQPGLPRARLLRPRSRVRTATARSRRRSAIDSYWSMVPSISWPIVRFLTLPER